MDDNIWLKLLLQVVLIALNAIFAAAEIAVISFNDAKLTKLAREGDKRAIRLAKLTEQPSRFLSTIQVAITLAGFLGSAFAADSFSGVLVDWVISLGVTIPAGTLDKIAVVIITLILSYFSLVIGELVPKRVAQRNPERVALGLSALIYAVAKISAPVVSLLTVSTNGVLRLLGIDPNANEEEVSEEDIRMMVDSGSENGSINETEKEFIHNVFEFDDLSAGEIATHRTEVALLWMEESDEEWAQTIMEKHHTYYPICDSTADQVVGVLSSKIYLRLADKSRESVMQNAVKPTYFVPDSIKADVLFRNMKTSRNAFAVVLDEYGGMSGIITMNDLIGQLVGDISDETTEEETLPEIEEIEEGVWRIVGTAKLREVEEALECSLPTEEYDTFNGFVCGVLNSIPEDGSQLEFESDGLFVRVTDVQKHQVQSALVNRIEKSEEDEEDADEEKDVKNKKDKEDKKDTDKDED